MAPFHNSIQATQVVQLFSWVLQIHLCPIELLWVPVVPFLEDSNHHFFANYQLLGTMQTMGPLEREEI